VEHRASTATELCEVKKLGVIPFLECDEDFQILGTALLQILCDYSHGQAPTLGADWHFTVIG
jgi:hypothetical protein